MTHTDNYGFDLYEAGDNANLLDGFNHNFQKLDQKMTTVDSIILSLSREVQLLRAEVDALKAGE